MKPFLSGTRLIMSKVSVVILLFINGDLAVVSLMLRGGAWNNKEWAILP